MSTLQADSQGNAHYLIPLSESKAKQWVENLPLTDVGETTKRLFHGLIDFNRRAVPPLVRIRISEMLHTALGITMSHLQRHLSYRAIPLPAKSQKIFELHQSLLLEFAGSYQLAALDMLTQNTQNKRALQMAVYRAIDHMGLVLLGYYSMYTRIPDAIWRDIHQLYLVGSEQGVVSSSFAQGRNGAPTISARYIQINLLALAKPYTLRQEEVFRVARYIEDNTALVSLSQEAEQTQNEYAHVAVLNADEPAVLMPSGDVLHSPTVRVFNLQKLLKQLAQTIDNSTSGAIVTLIPNGLTRNLAQRLVYNWVTMRNRSFNRFTRNEEIGVIARLPDILKSIRQTPTETTHAEQQHDEDLLYNTLSFGSEVPKPSTEKPLPTSDEVALQIWHVMNNSIGGYGLCWQHSEPSLARVGELVALQALGEAANPWMIGVVKWMEISRDKGLYCGVELLSSKVIPLRIKAIKNRTISQPLPIDGLMLPSIEGVRPEPVIILPAYIFHSYDEVTLSISENEEQVQLTVLDECLGSFAHFHFETLSKAKQQKQRDDFEGLWDTL